MCVRIGVATFFFFELGVKLDEESIGDGPKSPKRLLWPSRPPVLRMITLDEQFTTQVLD